MGSDMYMNPPKPVWQKVIATNDRDEALSWVIGAMANGWKADITPSELGKEDGIWTVRVFKGEYI